ncbi:MAG: DUF2797 domain-containing protein [Clostridia bacterium]|nr:DUF2797 domain-containing protein [Clostridia bacterium]
MIISGYSFNKLGPYLVFCDIKNGAYQSFSFENKNLNIVKKTERHCIGTYDLSSLSYKPCPHKTKIDLTSKINNCSECFRKIGFNPAFYNAKSISLKQLRYNELEHCVYMAYFSSSHIKVGIASKKRVYLRLLEQGARAAYILKTFSDAYLARDLEANLCYGGFGFLEKLTSNQKANILCSVNFNEDEAFTCLNGMLQKVNIMPESKFLNLNSRYFYNHNPENFSDYISYIKDTDYISGKAVGMVGDIIILKQNSDFFAVSIKNFISHKIELNQNDSFKSYEVQNKQLSLF